jgi:hypothetical protein
MNCPCLVPPRAYGMTCWFALGSMNMSYDSSNLTTPDIKWLGVRPSDLDRFNIPQQCRLSMTEEDIKTGKKLVRGTNPSHPLVPVEPAASACSGSGGHSDWQDGGEGNKARHPL